MVLFEGGSLLPPQHGVGQVQQANVVFAVADIYRCSHPWIGLGCAIVLADDSVDVNVTWDGLQLCVLNLFCGQTTELLTRRPHGMEDGGEFASQGDLRFLEAAAPGDAQAQALEPRKTVDARHQRIGRLVETAPKKVVAASGYPAGFHAFA